MAGRSFILGTSPRPWLISKLSHCPSLFLLIPTKGYSNQHSSTEIEAERAPSTAEEFERIAEEKLKDAEQGITCTKDARLGDSNPESVEKRHETREEGSEHKRLQKDD